MTATILPFNPLDKQHLGSSIAAALLEHQMYSLRTLAPFAGAGIYAIYYTGDFPAYHQLARYNRDGPFLWPIYVGKAVPAGARMGVNRAPASAGKVLHKRLREHADSLKAVDNLDIEDFYCRFLVVDDIWIPLGESLVITRFTPVWNTLIDGFGNHDPGKGRRAGMCPRWDVLHPGRPWAMHLAQRPESAAQIAQDAQTYLNVPPAYLSSR